MTKEEAIKWLGNLIDDIGQTRGMYLWPYAQALQEIISMLGDCKAAQPARLMPVEEVSDAEEGTVVWCEARAPGESCLNAMVCSGDGHIGNFYLGINLEDLASRNHRFWTQRPTDAQRKAVKWND